MNPEIVASLIGAGCGLFSAMCSGYVLWSFDQILKGVRGQIKGHDDRIRQIEGVLMGQKS